MVRGHHKTRLLELTGMLQCPPHQYYNRDTKHGKGSSQEQLLELTGMLQCPPHQYYNGDINMVRGHHKMSQCNHGVSHKEIAPFQNIDFSDPKAAHVAMKQTYISEGGSVSSLSSSSSA